MILRLLAWCLAWSAALPLGAAAAEQADKAVAAVRQMHSRGEIKPGTVLRLRVKQGNLASILGRDQQLQKEWESLTGVPIDASLMPQLDSLELIRAQPDVDLTLARNHEFADLFEAGLIEDLTPLLARLGFTLGEDSHSGYLLLRPQAMLGDKLVAIPADLDFAMLFLRADLLEDPQQRARFRLRHGHDPAPPRTWAEYQRLVAFYSRPQDGFYGSAEPREPLTGWMYWMPRYLSTAAPQRFLFDARMRPLIDSPAGVAATESYVATVAHSPPQVLEDGKDYSYTLPYFVRGQAFATVLTAATAKMANRADSAVRGKVIAVPMPGHRVGDRLVRRTTLIYGNNLVVPRSAAHKELAALFALWLTDPDHSVRSVAANGLADPYRRHHLRDEKLRELYTPQALDVARADLDIVTPSGTGLPGDVEYLAALNRHLWLAAAGRESPREAMARTAREWEAITERLGRARQIERWRAVRAQFPEASSEASAEAMPGAPPDAAAAPERRR